MKAVAEALRVSRFNLSERMKGKSKPRGPYLKADDVELLPAIPREAGGRAGACTAASLCAAQRTAR